MKWVLFAAALSLSVLQAWGDGDLARYDSRPDILSDDIVPKKFQGHVQPLWEPFSEAALQYTAELFALYPDQEIFFLARDGEYLYDAARLLTVDKLELQKRLHLINVNTKISKTPQAFRSYLKYKGFDEALSKGHVVLVDACCFGTIPKNIETEYGARGQRKTQQGGIFWHFVHGNKEETPSSRVFRSHYGDYDSLTNKLILQSDIGYGMERFPHYTATLDAYKELEDGSVLAMSKPYPPGWEHQQTYWKEYMQDLKFDLGRPDSRRRFERILKSMDATLNAAEKSEVELMRKHLGELGQLNVSGFADDVVEVVERGQFSRKVSKKMAEKMSAASREFCFELYQKAARGFK